MRLEGRWRPCAHAQFAGTLPSPTPGEDRDIRHYREVKFEAADQERQGRSAFKVMIAYERWLRGGGPERQRELAVLRLTGLFDRPMSKSCSAGASGQKPLIPGLTENLVKLTQQQWNIAVKRPKRGRTPPTHLRRSTRTPDSRVLLQRGLKQDQLGRFGRPTRGCLTTYAGTRRTDRTA